MSRGEFKFLEIPPKDISPQRLPAFHVNKHKHSRHFSALHLNINGLKIPQTNTSIYIQTVAFPPVWIFPQRPHVERSGKDERRLSPLTCVINDHCSFRCQVWFSTRWLPWFLRPVSQNHSVSAVICLDVHWCRVPAQVQNNAVRLMGTARGQGCPTRNMSVFHGKLPEWLN